MSALTHIDLALASQLSSGDRAAAAAMALASWATRQGHAGLPLDALAADDVHSALGEWRGSPPDAAAMREALRDHPQVGDAAARRPLVVDQGMLYLRRMWAIEHEVAERLSALAARQFVSSDAAADVLQQLLPEQDSNAAARAALRHAAASGLTVLTGGPGTGKTWTAARLLAYLQQVSPTPLRIVAAAPTGKAAARLTASLRDQSAGLTRSSLNAACVEAQTLHRLLGVQPFRAEPRHGASRPLPVDVLLLDESSMIDMPMLLWVLRALPDTARLILLGDVDQLPALGGGRVLADLLAVQSPTNANGEIRDDAICRVVFSLTRTHRFSAESPMSELLEAIRLGDASAAVVCLAAQEPTSNDGQISGEWADIDPSSARWRQVWRAGFAGLRADSISDRLHTLQRFRVLCAGAAGTRGVAGLNAAVELALFGQRATMNHYDGQPILIRENAPRLNLWNGDLGVVAPDSSGQLRAWFLDAESLPRALRLDSLPAHETSYAMTVHKSQGSEFENVVLVLPNPDSPLPSREWLYTGLSRGRSSVAVVGEQATFALAVSRYEQRWSRLAARLVPAAGML